MRGVRVAAAEGRVAQARVRPGSSACGAHGPNPSVERTGKWRLGWFVMQAWACAICRPLTSNVGHFNMPRATSLTSLDVYRDGGSLSVSYLDGEGEERMLFFPVRLASEGTRRFERVVTFRRRWSGLPESRASTTRQQRKPGKFLGGKQEPSSPTWRRLCRSSKPSTHMCFQ